MISIPDLHVLAGRGVDRARHHASLTMQLRSFNKVPVAQTKRNVASNAHFSLEKYGDADHDRRA
jgi:hypothetical protein